MDVLIVGASGYVGGAIASALGGRGHRVRGVARSDAARAKLEARGLHVVRADATKPQSLVKPVGEVEAVVYAVSITDAEPEKVEFQALRAIAQGLAGTEKTFVFISTAWVYGNTLGNAAGEEFAPVFPPPTLALRHQTLERLTLNMTKIGIRGTIVRPGIVYGDGGGIATMFGAATRERGRATIFGDGSNRWATIARSDLGRLVALVVERGLPGRAYNAVDGRAFTMSEIAVAGSRGAGGNGETQMLPPEFMGQLGACLELDQLVSAARAEADLGWAPQARSVVDDLEFGSYAGATALAR
ncbi:MAG: NAD-dependent epimerase/dehydratase family protein [Vulcanimicrobiaceae bacterium]